MTGQDGIRIVLASAGTAVGALAEGDQGHIGLISSGDRLAVLCMTDFGPSARVYDEAGPDMAAKIVSQSRGKYHTLLLSGAGLLTSVQREGDAVRRVHGGTEIDGFDAAIAAFRAARPLQPVARVDENGVELSRAWTLTPLGHGEIGRGDVLKARIGRAGTEGTVVMWESPDGRPVGVHLVMARRNLSESERLMDGTEATVVEATYGRMPGPGGDRKIQTLVLEAPTAFTRAFPDGKAPRHGGLDMMEGAIA